jgi:hypothetical protein
MKEGALAVCLVTTTDDVPDEVAELYDAKHLDKRD